MEILDKYISTTEKVKQPTSKSVVLSDDAYAIIEFIDRLNKSIDFLRMRIT